MPEPLELLVRGFEWRRVPVSEPDDGDPGDEVEVALAVLVREPAPVAVDERDREPSVGRKEWSSGSHTHGVTPPVTVPGGRSAFPTGAVKRSQSFAWLMREPPSCRSTRARRRGPPSQRR